MSEQRLRIDLEDSSLGTKVHVELCKRAVRNSLSFIIEKIEMDDSCLSRLINVMKADLLQNLMCFEDHELLQSEVNNFTLYKYEVVQKIMVIGEMELISTDYGIDGMENIPFIYLLTDLIHLHMGMFNQFKERHDSFSLADGVYLTTKSNILHRLQAIFRLVSGYCMTYDKKIPPELNFHIGSHLIVQVDNLNSPLN